MHKLSLKKAADILRDSARELSSNDPLRMAGATAFFTTFALPPILVIIILALGLVFNRRRLSGELFLNLERMLGQETVEQIRVTLRAFRHLATNWALTIALLLFLIFVATTLFKVIKASLNQVWNIRVESRKGFGKVLTARLQSVAVILFAGLLFLTGLFMEAVQSFLGKYIMQLLPDYALYVDNALNYIASIIIVTAWFTILFRYLPDARASWKVSFAGGLFTSILFSIGKLVVKNMLLFSNINTLYGASGSLVLLLLFVFYSSLMLYFGAAFTKVWSEYINDPIEPLPYAVRFQSSKIDIQNDEPPHQ